MGNSGGSSGLGSSGGNREHSRDSIAGHFAKAEMSEDEKLAWLMKTAGVSEKEAKEMLDAVESYLDGKEKEYKDIHNGLNKKAEELIDKLLNNRKVPTFSGETFRGVYIRPQNGRSARNIVEDILNTGRWHEPGITSFSSNRSVAMDFADPLVGSGRGASVVLRNVSNRSGVPVAHLSGHFNEFEVMHPSSASRRGFKINGWRRNGNIYYVDISE